MCIEKMHVVGLRLGRYTKCLELLEIYAERVSELGVDSKSFCTFGVKAKIQAGILSRQR
jgi:hypothetical protein